VEETLGIAQHYFVLIVFMQHLFSLISFLSFVFLPGIIAIFVLLPSPPLSHIASSRSLQSWSERVRYFTGRILNVRSDQKIKNVFGKRLFFLLIGLCETFIVPFKASDWRV